jgi:hypothetical protein
MYKLVINVNPNTRIFIESGEISQDVHLAGNSDPILSATSHGRKCGRLKQTYCGPGVKSKIRLDNVPPEFVAAGLAPALATPALAASALGAGFVPPALAFGAGFVPPALAFGAGFGTGFVPPALAFGAGFGTGFGVSPFSPFGRGIC